MPAITRNQTLDSIFSRAWWLTDFSIECSQENVSSTSSVHVGRKGECSTDSLRPYKTLPSHVAFFQLVYSSETDRDSILLTVMQFLWYGPRHTWQNALSLISLVIMDPQLWNKPFILKKAFRYFLLSKFTRQKFFLWLMRHVN